VILCEGEIVLVCYHTCMLGGC